MEKLRVKNKDKLGEDRVSKPRQSERRPSDSAIDAAAAGKRGQKTDGTPFWQHTGEVAPEASLYDRLFRKHLNSTFGRDAEVAFRGAVLIVIAGLPFIMPQHHVKESTGDGYHVISEGWYNPYIIGCFLFAYYKDVGNTVAFAVSGTFGVCLAFFAAWILFGVFPESITPESGAAMYGITFAYGAVYVFVMLWLNVDTNLSVFAISSFVWYLMLFLDPKETQSPMATGFKLEFQGSAAKACVSSAVGSLFAVVCMLVPFPMSALGKAIDSANDAIPDIFAALTGLTEIACAASPEDMNEFIVAKLKRELHLIADNVRCMEGHLDAAWWECLGIGAGQRQREILKKLDKLITEIYDRFMAVSCICLRDATPSDMMGRVQPFIETVAAEAHYLLVQGLAAVRFGDISAERAELLTLGAARLRSAVQALTMQFRMVKAEAEGPNSITVELLGESAFCLTVCAFGRTVAEWAEDAAERKEAVGTPRAPQREKMERTEEGGFLGLGALAGIVDRNVLFHDKHHLTYVARMWCSICIAFVLGWSSFTDFGAEHPVRQHNAAIASAVAVLLSKSPGSAIVRNTIRMQGAILGTSLGTLIYVFFGSCALESIVAFVVVIFLYSAYALFLYNNSSENSDMGFLLVYFGTGAMLIGCGHHTSGGLGRMVVNLLLTVIVMSAVDLIFQGKNTASHQSHDALHHSLTAVRNSASEIFDPDVQVIALKHQVLKKIAWADMMGYHANNEPRWHKTPWRNATFKKAIQMAYNMRYITIGMKCAAMGGSRRGAKSYKFQSCLGIKEFMACAGRPAQRMAQVEQMLEILLEEQDTRSIAYRRNEDEIMTHMTQSHFQHMVEEACKALNQSVPFSSRSDSESLENDHTIQVSYQLAALGALIYECRTLAAEIIAEG